MFFGQIATVEQRVQKSAVSIMNHEKWRDLGSVIMVGDRRVCNDTPTGYTNGRDVVFGRAFVEGLNDAQLRFLDIHEQMHKAKRHLITWSHLWEADANLANQAMDFNINLEMMDYDAGEGFIAFPTEGLCYDEKYRSWDVARIFHDLKKEAKDNPGPGRGQGGKPLDEHGFGEVKEMTADEKHAIEREIDEAVRQGNLVGGKLGSGGKRIFGELLDTQVNWREVMQEFLQTTCDGSDLSTWKRPNRRYIASGYYMPSTYSETIGPILNGNDMSGSIGEREIAVIQAELVSITKLLTPTQLHVTYWDTKVCGHEIYEPEDYDDIASKTKPVGGGGTDVTCIPEYMKEHDIKAQCAVIITDGHLYGGWGEWDCPVLWVIIDNPNAQPTHGIAVHVKSHDLR